MPEDGMNTIPSTCRMFGREYSKKVRDDQCEENADGGGMDLEKIRHLWI